MANFDQDYDVIIIGGGINGLTAGCYLQKAGSRCSSWRGGTRSAPSVPPRNCCIRERW